MTPLLEARNISKRFGPVVALKGVTFRVFAGEVHCLLGDNGAGKSTLIKILSGVFPPDEGELLLEGKPVRFNSPKDAMDRGIGTVYQDLAVIPLMSIVRNFFLGREPTTGWGPFRRFDLKKAEEIAKREVEKIGIRVRDVHQPESDSRWPSPGRSTSVLGC